MSITDRNKYQRTPLQNDDDDLDLSLNGLLVLPPYPPDVLLLYPYPPPPYDG